MLHFASLENVIFLQQKCKFAGKCENCTIGIIFGMAALAGRQIELGGKKQMCIVFIELKTDKCRKKIFNFVPQTCRTKVDS